MSQLKVETSPALGPLSVQLLELGGRPVGQRVMLSSAKLASIFPDIPQGDYVVAATRPSGDVLTQAVTVGVLPATLTLTPEPGQRSPHEHLQEAADRGLVPTVLASTPHDVSLSSLTTGLASSAAGSAGRALAAVLHSAAFNAPFDAGAAFDSSDGEGGLDESYTLDLTPKPHPSKASFMGEPLELRAWSLAGGPPDVSVLQPLISADYIQLAVPAAHSVWALGLLDRTGRGPIIIVPPLHDGLDITLLASGVDAASQTQRVTNPSGVRTPVAVVKPRDAGLADLFSAAGAEILPGAAELWSSSAASLGGGTDYALEKMLYKMSDPVSALIAALFLSRFAPQLAPINWMRNLARITRPGPDALIPPGVADGAVLLADRLVRYGEKSDASEAALLLEGVRNAPCLFSSSRARLNQALRLLGATRSATRDDLISPGAYLDAALGAGGFEAFWGGGPASPGANRPIDDRGIPLRQLRLSRGEFRTSP